MGFVGPWKFELGLEFELFLSVVALFLSVLGFVEQRVRNRGLALCLGFGFGEFLGLRKLLQG